MAAPTDGALAGLRVVEIAQNAAVPQCGRLLAGLGADVVKVEPPEGDAMRGLEGLGPTEDRAFAVINPGKRGICVDLRSAGAREVVDALLDWADVLLVGLKHGDLARYGLDWPRVHARNPALTQLVLTAFGPHGPDADQGGYDVLVQGVSGLGFLMNRSEGGAPLPTRPALFDFASGAIAALGVVTALRERDRTGVGQRVDASLLGAAMALGTPMLARFGADRAAVTEILADLALLREADADFDTQRAFYEARVVAGGGVFMLYFRHYLTADGLISVAGMSPTLMRRFHEVTGVSKPTDRDPASDAFRAVVREAEACFAERSTAAWLQLLHEAGYPASRYNLPLEAIDDPQIEANDYVVDLDHPLFGRYRTVGMPFALSDTPTGVRGPSPRLGADTDSVLAEIGLDADDIMRLRRAGVVKGTDDE